MEIQNECYLLGYPNVYPYTCIKEIINQMEKSLCKIKIEPKKQGTGFPCRIPFPTEKELLPVLITNNHIINKKALYEKDKKITINIGNEKQKIINLNNRRKYTNKYYDITIIELKESDGINNFLELDEAVVNYIIKNDDRNEDYVDNTIYIIQYAEGMLSASYGILNGINENKDYNYNFRHTCCTKNGSSGSPILNLKNKIIGIHKGFDSYNIGSFLNYAIKEFINVNKRKKLLSELNEKYKLDIKDRNIEKIIIGNKIIGDEGFDQLMKIHFKKLKTFYLCSNNITNITPLLEAKFEKLEKLHLENNKISDINLLEKVELKELKELSFNQNYIQDIKVLKKVKFEKLEKLNLSWNKISDINILEKLNFKELKELNLGGNNISDIKVFSKVKFKKLEVLCLGNNKISDINVLKDVKFEELKELLLYANEISDINVFEHVKFNKLEVLSFGINKIKDIKVLDRVYLEKLKVLGFSKNNVISNLDILKKVKFPKLEKLTVDNNGIDDKKNSSILSDLAGEYDYFYYNEKEPPKKFRSRMDSEV